MRKRSIMGFTLLETMIVIGIMTILAAVGSPSFFRYQAERQLTKDVSNVAAMLRQTQLRAVSQEGGAPWGVHLEYPASGTLFYQVFNWTYATGTRDVRANLGAKVVFVAPSPGNSVDVIFAKRTGLPLASTTITLALRSSTSTTQKNIIVNEQGNIERP